MWSSIWARSGDCSFDPGPLRQVLAELPRPDDADVDLQITPDGLRKATRRMLKKACGADGWEADFLRLPDLFWSAASRLWNRALLLGQLPTSWTSALVVLIPKPDGRTRPIGLLPILWRAGARCLVKQLRNWCSSWTTAQAMGGLAGIGVADAHMRLMGANKRGTRSYVKQDLSHFFDSLTLDVLVPLLQHYKAPSALVRLVQAMYRSPQRLFKVGHFTSAGFASVNSGVVQGCPLSPLLSLLVGQAWASYAVMQTPEIRSLVYIDDRLLRPTSRTPAAGDAMRRALQRSDFFDKALELQCKPEKCALAHSPQATELVPLIAERGYPCVRTLDFLGIQFDLLTQQCTPLKLDLDKVKWRIRYLRRLGAPFATLKMLLASLVSSALFWASGVAKPQAEDFRLLNNELYYLFQANFLQDTPRLLIHELMDWRSEPQFACDIAAFQAVVRYVSRVPEWREQVPLTEAFDNWRDVLPLAVQAIERCGWQILQNGRELQRDDDCGNRRIFRFGSDSLAIVEDWLRIEYRRRFMRRCGRVRQRLHRDGHFASGFDLPAPEQLDFSFEGHKKVFLQASSVPLRRAAAATGGSIWYWTAGLRLQEDDARLRCLCGELAPSRAHLTWVCPRASSCREGLQAPTHRAEERLFTARQCRSGLQRRSASMRRTSLTLWPKTQCRRQGRSRRCQRTLLSSRTLPSKRMGRSLPRPRLGPG